MGLLWREGVFALVPTSFRYFMTLALPEIQPMRLSPSALRQRLLSAAVARPDAVEIVPLAGDASARRYFRLLLSCETGAAADPASLVAMELEVPQPDAPMEWLEIHRYLSGIDLPVPHVFDYLAGEGVLILEDLGDATLEERLKQAGADEAHAWYEKAVDLLAHLQARATAPEPTAFSRRFDVEKLMWEFDFMLEHYAAGLLGRSLSPSLAQTLREEMTALCRELEALPAVLCHRDYHSRNLMVRGGDLVMIDFQDARLGPPQYDLVSLLRDAYNPLDEIFVQEMKARFLSARQTMTGNVLSPVEFDRGFDRMTVQRCLKAVGTFAFQKTVKGNDRYLPGIAPSLFNVSNALKRHADLGPLRNALEEALPPLRQAGGAP